MSDYDMVLSLKVFGCIFILSLWILSIINIVACFDSGRRDYTSIINETIELVINTSIKLFFIIILFSPVIFFIYWFRYGF